MRDFPRDREWRHLNRCRECNACPLWRPTFVPCRCASPICRGCFSGKFVKEFGRCSLCDERFQCRRDPTRRSSDFAFRWQVWVLAALLFWTPLAFILRFSCDAFLVFECVLNGRYREAPGNVLQIAFTAVLLSMFPLSAWIFTVVPFALLMIESLVRIGVEPIDLDETRWRLRFRHAAETAARKAGDSRV